jgi:hypothetical protein
MWAAKHCSILFSSVLHQPEHFYMCSGRAAMYPNYEILDVIMIFQVQECVDKYARIFVFSVENMRNTKLKDVRNEWKHSR